MIKLNIQLFGGRGASSSRSGSGKPNEATEHYVSGEGMWINQYLRGQGDFGELSNLEKEYLKDLDKATNGKIKNDTLYRNVDASAIFGDISQNDYELLKEKIIYNENNKYTNATSDKYLKNIIGKSVKEKGFMSTTKDEKIANDFDGYTGSSKPIIMKIKTSKNTKGVDLSRYDKNVSKGDAQKEVLLARKQQGKITNVYSKNGHIYVDFNME